MTEYCDHEIVEPITCDATGDTVDVCCDCGEKLGAARLNQLPLHWFRNCPEQMPDITLAADVINGEFPRNIHNERYVHMCGSCGHSLSAVHSGYFDGDGELNGGWIDQLKEALCPACGSALFRHTSIVAPYSATKELPLSTIKSYIFDRADQLYWHSTAGGPSVGPDIIAIEIRSLDDDYHARCPCCGYAKKYGHREFDFHHWEYDDEMGCTLCRDCHQHIHRGLKAKEQTAKTGCAWQYDAVGRLFERCKKYGLEFDGKAGFMQRFNIPQEGVPWSAVGCIAREIKQHDGFVSEKKERLEEAITVAGGVNDCNISPDTDRLGGGD